MNKKDFTFLLVDDDSQFLDGLHQLIVRKGYQCTRVSKPEDAINLARIKIFHGAFIDCMLPRTNGVKLAEELRKTRFGQTPIVFMSGIFKDKGFATDAMSRTNALDFLIKPLNAERLSELMQAMVASVSGEKEHPPLNRLLSGPGSKPRAQIKAIESLEKISGFDFAFVLSTLMKIKFSGYLNISGPQKKIFGLTFQEGKIIQFDSEDQNQKLEALLIENGFAADEDLLEIGQMKKSNHYLADLIKKNYLSPHASDIVMTQFITNSIGYLFVENSMEFSLSPSQVEAQKGPQIEMAKLFILFNDFAQRVASIEDLKKFYNEWTDYPLRKTDYFSPNHPVFNLPLFAEQKHLIQSFNSEPTVGEANKQHSDKIENFYRCLHLLTLTDLVRFDSRPRASDRSNPYEQLVDYQSELKDKDAQEIFEFFGASDRVLVSEVETIYREFAKSNHPDRMPPDIDPDILKAVNEVYGMVSNAYKTLVDENLREKFFAEKKQNAAKEQIKAETMLEEGLNLLRKGQVSLALDTLAKSYELHQSDRALVIMRWAEVKKTEQKPDIKRLDQILSEFDSIDVEEKRGPYCQLVIGLIYKAKKDYSSAYDHIDRALAADPSFIDARREIAALSKMTKKTGGADFLTGDITASITNLFKKKIK